MHIDADFPCGNIDVVGAAADGTVRLRLRADPLMGFKQWFYFSADSGGRPAQLVIENADDALVPKGWPDYQAFASTDQQAWGRVATDYRDGKLVIPHPATAQKVFYAYFPPYDAERRAALMAFCAADHRLAVSELCATGFGGAVDLVQSASPAVSPLNIWILCRQHPGEVQGSWWADGFLRALLDPRNAHARDVLARARLFIAPNMNPDGSARGHHRTNGFGVNLNASWNAASADTSPAVFHTLRKMDELGVDFCLDVHGDEELPHVFAARVDTLAPVPAELEAVRREFQTRLAATNPDFHVDGGYVRGHTLADPLSFCSPNLMRRYGCPAVTLELPYKTIPDEGGGRHEFGPEGSVRMGRSCLTALGEVLDAIEALKRARAAGGPS